MRTHSVFTSSGLQAPHSSRAVLNPARARRRATYLNLTLWNFQAWMAMFFIAAGYAKLTEPQTILIELMGWPAFVELDWVRVLGGVEAGLATLSLAPLLSWRIGRPVLLATAGSLLLFEMAALGLHVCRGDVGLAFTNALLLAITTPILIYRIRR